MFITFYNRYPHLSFSDPEKSQALPAWHVHVSSCSSFDLWSGCWNSCASAAASANATGSFAGSGGSCCVAGAQGDGKSWENHGKIMGKSWPFPKLCKLAGLSWSICFFRFLNGCARRLWNAACLIFHDLLLSSCPRDSEAFLRGTCNVSDKKRKKPKPS